MATDEPPLLNNNTSPGSGTAREGVQLPGVVQSAEPLVAFHVYEAGPDDVVPLAVGADVVK